MSGTIIVGVTDAASSRSAQEWALRRARETGRRLVLFAVVGGAVGAVGEDEVVTRVVSRARDALERVVAEVSASGVAVEARIESGNPVALLVDASTDAELLVIGGEPRGHGHRGQHGARIAAGAHCPVVVVPEADSADRRGVVVGVDGSEVSDAAIDFAAAEAQRAGETLTVVSAWMPVAMPGDFGVYPDLYLTDLQGITQAGVDRVLERVRADHPGLDVVAAVAEGEPSTVIGDHARSARLTVVGSHGRGAFARFLLGSVSEQVVANLESAVAVVR
ncbi:universal stress protein [Microbacterium sp. 18062]|uniref:universal stress protein n=1 Tax=Microbacterium sp. 18062 TaxID=2681410 RepID=UPI001358688C|nr:universal stress protein [Microbacterium sp. 18062]